MFKLIDLLLILDDDCVFDIITGNGTLHLLTKKSFADDYFYKYSNSLVLSLDLVVFRDMSSSIPLLKIYLKVSD